MHSSKCRCINASARTLAPASQKPPESGPLRNHAGRRASARSLVPARRFSEVELEAPSYPQGHEYVHDYVYPKRPWTETKANNLRKQNLSPKITQKPKIRDKPRLQHS